jgi:cell division inhibitor SulA
MMSVASVAHAGSNAPAFRPFVESNPQSRVDPSGNRCLATGHAELDRELPGGGWPVSRVSELLVPEEGLAELHAIVPVLQMLTRSSRTVLLLNPPGDCVATLARLGVARSRLLVIGGNRAAEQLWAIEQAAARDDFGALVAWAPDGANDEAIHRLDRAMRQSQGICLLFRPLSAARDITPAALRVILQADAPDRLQMSLLVRASRRIAASREVMLRPGIIVKQPPVETAPTTLQAQGPGADELANQAKPSARRQAPIVPSRTPMRSPWPFTLRRALA